MSPALSGAPMHWNTTLRTERGVARWLRCGEGVNGWRERIYRTEHRQQFVTVDQSDWLTRGEYSRFGGVPPARHKNSFASALMRRHRAEELAHVRNANLPACISLALHEVRNRAVTIASQDQIHSTIADSTDFVHAIALTAKKIGDRLLKSAGTESAKVFN
jgi:hypothetical protein